MTKRTKENIREYLKAIDINKLSKAEKSLYVKEVVHQMVILEKIPFLYENVALYYPFIQGNITPIKLK